MVIVGDDNSGNCRICSLKKACNPPRRMSRLTTLASTGLRTKMSVMERMSRLFARARAQRLQSRIRIDADAGIRLQLDLTLANHELAGLHAFVNRDLVFARVAGAHETTPACI